MSTNRVSITIPEVVITQITAAANEVKTALQPYLQGLTNEERHDLPKMSNKSFTFVSKVNDYCGSNPEFRPSFLDSDELKKDFEAVAALKPLLDLFSQIAGNIDDTLLLAGSEAYSASLMYYGAVKMASKTGQPNAKPIYEDLSARFPGRQQSALKQPVNQNNV